MEWASSACSSRGFAAQNIRLAGGFSLPGVGWTAFRWRTPSGNQRRCDPIYIQCLCNNPQFADSLDLVGVRSIDSMRQVIPGGA